MQKQQQKRMAKGVVWILTLLLLLGSTSLAWAAGKQTSFTDQLLWKILIPLANFIVLVWILLKAAGPFLRKFLQERHEKIKLGVAKFEERTDEIAQRYREVKEKLANVVEREEDIIQKAREYGHREKERMVEKAKRQAEKLRREAENTCELEMKQLNKELREETVMRAMTKAEKMIQQQITAADQERLNAEYLEQIGEMS